jgi:hypothetical protein
LITSDGLEEVYSEDEDVKGCKRTLKVSKKIANKINRDDEDDENYFFLFCN